MEKEKSNGENWELKETRQKFYQSMEWRNLRKYVLDNEPLCRACYKKGKISAAREVDHIVDIKKSPEDRLNINAVQPLCHSCHSRKTMKELNKNKKKATITTIVNRLWKL